MCTRRNILLRQYEQDTDQAEATARPPPVKNEVAKHATAAGNLDALEGHASYSE